MPRRIGLLLSFVVVAVFSLPFPQAFSVTRLIWHITHSSGVGTNYYIANEGNDANPGTLALPWQTISHIYGHGAYKPGDNILFKGGQIFSGALFLDNTTNSATAASPLTISSYGTGRATISNTTGTGIFIYRAGNIAINNINVVGGGGGASGRIGIEFGHDQDGVTLGNVIINNVDVSGFTDRGIYFYGSTGTDYWNNIRITNSRVHDNAVDGIFLWSGGGNTKTTFNVYIGNVETDHNGSANTNTGSGIILANVQGGTVEYCNSHHNNDSAATITAGGPYAIWTYQSDGIVFQHNEMHHNATTSNADGGGIDFDGGTSNSIAQYNYSHDNAGPGYTFVYWNGASNTENNTVRYNISENDNLTSTQGQGGILVWAETGTNMVGNKIYNNTIYNNTTTNSSATALYSFGGGSVNTGIYNNIFVSTGGKDIIHMEDTHTGLTIKGNDYFGTSFRASFLGTLYTSLAAFRSGTGQETGAGLNVDPLLVSAGAGGTIAPLPVATMSAYKLQAGSPMIDQGQNLLGLGITVGSIDFFGDAIPLGAGYDIGAHERQ